MKSCNAFWINAFTICLILHCVNSNHFDCNFKHNPCEWKVIRGWSPIRIDSGGMSSDGVSNDLLSPRHKPTNGSCLTVSIESGDTAIFSVIIEKEGERPETLYRLDDEYYYQKVKDHVTIQSRKFFKIRLHADVSYYDSDTPTQSYLYGVTLKETACRDTVFDCDFEDKDICDYKNVNYIDGLWKRKNENSSFSKEGHPKYDHTSGPYGSYLYVSDKDMLWGDFFYPDQLSAIISSEDIPKGNYCITIWYQIYGKAKLHLSCESDNHMYDNNEIVSSCGNGVWNTFQFSVNIKNEDFKLMLEGKIISRTSNWIAVDDIDVNKGDCAATGFCEFTTNLCTWSNMYCKDRWMVATSKTPGKPRDGPLYDVNSKGGYAYLRKHIDDRKEKFATARLLSVNIDSSKYKCFKFRYHMPKNIGSLSIITADIEGKEKIRWTLHGKQKQDWQQGTVPLSTGNSYGNMNLIIQGKLYTISNQTIAVDDVGFFTDSCDLKPTVANPVTLNTTAVPMESTTKILSHSWKTFDCDFNHRLCEWTRKRGWKKYLGKRGLSNNGVVSDLISPEHGSTNGSCLTISSKAGDTAVFSVIVEEDEEKPRTVYQVGSRKHYKYRKVYVTIQSRNTFKIILHAARYDSWDRQDIQLFEISLKEVACRDTVYDCDFEDDECGYLNTMTYIGSWKRRNENSSFSDESHPAYDHSFGAYGSYLYLSRKEFHWNYYYYPKSLKTTIISEYIKSGKYCVTIWYQIYGKAELHLLCRSHYDRKTHKFTSSYGSGVWNAFQFQVNFYYKFKLSLEGNITSRDSNWIAVDDVDVNYGDCSPPGFCDFSTNLCTWSNMFYEEKWIVVDSKQVDAQNGGPESDGKNTGGYAFFREHIDDSNAKSVTARLMSVEIDSSKYKCFKFRYYSSEEIGSLSVISADFKGKETVRWTLLGKQKQHWQQGTVPLSTGKIRGKMNIIIQGRLYKTSNQSIAVDDVGFVTDSCDLTPTSATPIIQVTTVAPFESTTERHVVPSKSFDCDFNNRLCEWKRIYGWSNYLGTGGIISKGDKNDLISPEHEPTNGSCLIISFKSGEVSSFSVIIEKNGGSSTTVYQIGSSSPYIYRKGYVTIESRKIFKIRLHAALHSSWYMRVRNAMLYGVTMKAAACRDTAYDCDFEDEDICEYMNFNTYVGSWKRRNENSSFSTESHPKYDHTLGTYGSYLYLSRKKMNWGFYGNPPSLQATVRSQYVKTGRYCVTIWYQIYGDALLNLLLKSYHDDETHKCPSSYGSGVWNAFQFPVNSTSRFRLYFKGTITLSDANWIAVDDVDINNGDCSPPGFCDFSTNLCTWSNMFYEEKWIVVDSKQVDAQNGGPESDGKNTGGYAFFREHIDDSNAKSVTARLMSVEIDSSKYKCFKFRYYSSEEIGSLSVISADFKGKETVRWTLLGKQKQHWQQGTVPLSTGKIRGKMNIIIQGRLYKTSNQSIAVDDVGFVTDSCDLTPTSATPIIQVTTVAPFESSTERHVVPSKSFDCDFNNRLCEWKRIYGWSNYLGTGGIISKGDKNDLISPEHEPTNGSCLIISFKSGEVSSFSVIIEKNGGSSTTVYQIGSSSPYIYRKGYVTIESRKIFKIRLHAEGGYSSWYMRVRNAMLYGVTMKEAACRDTAYDCDFEDEDICEYMNFNTYVGSWKRRNENSSFSTESHPKYDHTLGTYGSYLYLSRKKMNWGFYGNPPSLQATVRSQYVKTGRYCVTIWYQIYGDALLNLLLKSYHDDETHKCPSSYGSGVWNAFQFPVNSTSRFRLYFKGTITLSDANWIAVDDVDINNGDCSPPGFCDFSTNLCTWSNMFYEDKWIVVDSKTVDKKTSGPVPAEKTTGGYAYFRKRVEDSETKSPTARLLSTNVDTSKYKCFKFQYYMHGENMGSLSVITADSLGNESIVWELHGSQQHVWQHGTVPLSTAVRDKRINLIIQAKLSTSSNEIMAVDDVGFFKESCHIKPAIANPVDLVTTVTPFISTRQNHTMLQTTSETALPKTVCTVNTMLQTTSETALPKTETTKKYNSATTSNSPTSHTPRQTHSITTTSLPTTSQTAKQTPSTTTTTASTNFKTPKRTPKTKTTNIPTYETSKQSLSTATMKNSPTTSEIPKRTPSKTTASLPTKSQTAKQTPSTTTTTASTTFKTPKRTPKTKTTNIPIYETSKQRLSTATMKNSPTTSETPKQTSSKTTAISLPTKSETAKQTPSTTTTTASTTFKTPKRTPKTKTTNIPTYETSKQRLSTATMKNSPTTSETPKQTSSKTTAISLPTKSETAKQTPSTTITTASTTFKTPKRTPKTKTTNISTYETTKQTPSKTTTNYATTSRTPEFFTSVETTETSTTPKEYKYTTSKMPVTGISKTSSTSEATGKTGTSGTKSTKEFARTTPQVSNNVVFLTTKGWKGEEAKSKGSHNAEKSKTGLGGPAGISGIVIGILIIILTVTVAIYIHRRRRIRKTQEGMLTTGNRFENPLFEIGDATFSQSQA